jgi:hypothetical protein
MIWLPNLATGCGTYVVGKVVDTVVDAVTDDPSVYTATKALLDSYRCLNMKWTSCFSLLDDAAKLGMFVDSSVADQKVAQINETIRKIEGDAITTTIPQDLLANLLLLGIEVNNGRNPPNIVGTYLSSPTVLVRSNFNDSLSPGQEFSDLQLTFSNQNNNKMTVDINSIQGTSSMMNSSTTYITGEGMKFSVISEMSSITDVSESVYIYIQGKLHRRV